MVYVRSKGDTEATRAALVNLLPNYRIRSMAEYMSLMTSSNLPELKPFISSFVILGPESAFSSCFSPCTPSCWNARARSVS